MTEEERTEIVALTQNNNFLDQAARTQHDLEAKVGNTERKRHMEINSVLFLRTLVQRCNGTFVWEEPKSGDRHDNIFEALSTLVAGAPDKKGARGYNDLSLREKNEHIEEIAPKLRHGFNSARKWLAQWYGATVYCVPQHNESSIQTVMTIDPNFVLANGRTAGQMQEDRDYKLALGQMKSSALRAVASSGDGQADSLLGRIMDGVREALAQELDERQQLQNRRRAGD
jgi:hypothetical protein